MIRNCPTPPNPHPSCFSAPGYAGGAATSEDKSFVVIKARQVGGQIQVSKKGCGGIMTEFLPLQGCTKRHFPGCVNMV